jgi:formate dehydrogenase subunit gamma
MAASLHRAADHVEVDRYSGAARVNHWITAISLILLAISGMSLFYPGLFFLSDLFGGGQFTRIVHPWIGVVLLISFAGLFLRFWRANLWERTDTVWMRNPGAVLGAHEERLPDVGRYNAGQKLVFWGMTLLIVVLFVTGIIIWDRYFFAWTSIETKRIAIVVHAAAAVCAIVIWIVHVYAAIWVRGTVRAMTRGSVTGGWAWRHHRRWLRDEVAKGPPA